SRETSVLAEAGLEKHSPWLKELLERYNDVTLDEVDEIMKHEVGEKFVAILECCGVYKLTEEGLEGIQRFINSINCSL
ncbi:MAG: galactose-1-phosphate uridylyltransferase, partial [Turicibacter sp.]|nr:galactose-1-phosphate uridylyltransferase [Turicibacter sp.]